MSPSPCWIVNSQKTAKNKYLEIGRRLKSYKFVLNLDVIIVHRRQFCKYNARHSTSNRQRDFTINAAIVFISDYYDPIDTFCVSVERIINHQNIEYNMWCGRINPHPNAQPHHTMKLHNNK